MTDTSPTASAPPLLPQAVALVASVLQMDPATLAEDDGMETLAQWDSLKVLMLASMIEIDLGITLDNSEIEQLITVRAVSQVLARHGRS